MPPMLKLAVFLSMILFLMACNPAMPTPTATPLPSPTIVPSPTNTLTPTTAPSPTVTASPTALPTMTVTPTLTSATSTIVPLPFPTGSPVSMWKDVPIMLGAIDVREENGTYTYSVKGSIFLVLNFYEREMPPRGWQPLATGSGKGDAVIWLYKKDNINIGILMTPQSDLTNVQIIFP